MLGKPQVLIEGVKISVPFFYGYAISKDGEKLLAYRGAGMDDQQQGVTVVENWYSEFRDRK